MITLWSLFEPHTAHLKILVPASARGMLKSVCHGASEVAGQSWEESQMHISLQKKKKINPKKLNIGRSSLSLRVWLSDAVAGQQPADLNTSRSFILVYF